MGMARIYLLEGADNCGKSTICEFINELDPSEYIHLVKPMNNQSADEMFRTPWDRAMELNKTGKNVILDRHFISNIVYRNVFPQNAVSDCESDYYLNCLTAGDNKIILCLPSDREKYLTRFNEQKADRKEMFSTMDKIHDLFHDLYYGIKNDSEDGFYNKIIFAGGLKSMKNVVLYDMDKVPLADVKDWVGANIIVG